MQISNNLLVGNTNTMSFPQHMSAYYPPTDTARPRTHLVIVMDESGSMASQRETAIQAINKFMSDQREETSDDCLVSLHMFNTWSRRIYENTPIQNTRLLAGFDYNPNGGTALLDAVGAAIEMVDLRVDYRKDRVVVIVLTDGEENSSSRWTNDRLASAIRLREATGRWTFVYLGANQDAWHAAGRFGLNHNAYNTHATQMGLTAIANNLSEATLRYRGGNETFTASYFSQDEAKSMSDAK